MCIYIHRCKTCWRRTIERWQLQRITSASCSALVLGAKNLAFRSPSSKTCVCNSEICSLCSLSHCTRSNNNDGMGSDVWSDSFWCVACFFCVCTRARAQERERERKFDRNGQRERQRGTEREEQTCRNHSWYISIHLVCSLALNPPAAICAAVCMTQTTHVNKYSIHITYLHSWQIISTHFNAHQIVSTRMNSYRI